MTTRPASGRAASAQDGGSRGFPTGRPDALATINEAENAISKFEQADVRHQRRFAVHVLFKRRQP